ncbi:hypothetical protein [Streptosporangium amethystogenes]|uniref:hypothetical protein n=1 Tax=Streptosporangium amethystogenes TaxID=2002 RepID=UPI0012FC3927|nr:hypothetical protein [Streptosporangium amethystogenes]
MSHADTSETLDLVAEDVTELSWEELTKEVVNYVSPCRGGCGTSLPSTISTNCR